MYKIIGGAAAIILGIAATAFSWGELNNQSERNGNCTLCRDPVSQGPNFYRRPNCGCIFHEHCYRQTESQGQLSCPGCMRR